MTKLELHHPEQPEPVAGLSLKHARFLHRKLEPLGFRLFLTVDERALDVLEAGERAIEESKVAAEAKPQETTAAEPAPA